MRSACVLAGLLSGWISLCAAQTIDSAREAPADNTPSQGAWHAAGKQGAVSTGGQEAAQAGLATLQAGGNAADAAVASILALAVTDSNMFCLGGEFTLLVYDAQHDRIEAVIGQGAAPQMATRELFAATGGIPKSCLRAAAVPAALDACVQVLKRYGTRRFADVAGPAQALLARHRKVWHADLEQTLQRLVAAERAAGTDRLAALQAVSDYFYRGPLAAEIAQWCADNDGLIRAADLAAHKTLIEPPVSAEYRGHRVFKCGPGTQGPWLLEALELLAGFDLERMGPGSADAIHATVEAMKLALADRDVYYGDPAFVDVPIEKLLSPEYALLRRPLIDMRRASLVQRPGDPRAGKPLLDQPAQHGAGNPDHDTTTCLVADKLGNVVAATPSGWDGVLVGKTGIWLGSRLQSFNTWAGHPNCIQPGKRPRITLSPTLVTHDGKPVLAISVAGGDGQDQAALQMIIDRLDFHLTPAQSVTAVRFGTNHLVGSFGQTPPALGSLLIYPQASGQTREELTARGHKLTLRAPPLWSPSVLAIEPALGGFDAAGDPKAGRHSAAY